MITSLHAGTAGEHLVCADLIISGYSAFLTDQDSKYDLILDTGQKLLRVQVKTSQCSRKPQKSHHNATVYVWQVGFCGKNGKTKKTRYADDSFDLVALVAMDRREIAYLPSKDVDQDFISLNGEPGEQKRGKLIMDYSLSSALERIKDE